MYARHLLDICSVTVLLIGISAVSLLAFSGI
jgi:hypothetical protein